MFKLMWLDKQKFKSKISSKLYLNVIIGGEKKVIPKVFKKSICPLQLFQLLNELCSDILKFLKC